MEKISKYLEDKYFIQWIFNSTPELEKWWNLFELENPQEKENIQLARNILHRFQTKDNQLNHDEKIRLFTNILKNIENRKENNKRIKPLIVLARYAAVAILFFSLGVMLLYNKDSLNRQFYSESFSEPASNNNAQLIRSDGENYIIQEEKSTIEYKKDGQLIINDEVLESKSKNKNVKNELNQLIIPYGKMTNLILPDGTKVTLNAGSKLIYPDVFSNEKREVFLIGEAFFDVFEDSNHPFIVQTTDINLEVLGTKFNVSAYGSDNMYETVLVKGKVRIKQNQSNFFDKSIVIQPNQKVTFNRTLREMEVKEVDVENYVLWQEGILKFESDDLNRVTKKLERFYNIQIRFDDVMLSIRKISGKLDLQEELDVVLQSIATAASVRIEKKGDKFYEVTKL